MEGLERQVTHDRAHFGLPDSVFTFGYIFDVNSYVQRKNPLALIEAFRREFGDSADVLLVLKQSHGGGPRSAAAEICRAPSRAPATSRFWIPIQRRRDRIFSQCARLLCVASPERRLRI